MEELGIETQPELAKATGVAQSHISRIMSGAQSIGLDIIWEIADGLDCEPWELLVDDDATRERALKRMLGRPPSPAPKTAVHKSKKRRRKDSDGHDNNAGD